MLKRILLFLIPLFLFLALFLKLNGVDRVEFTSQYYEFMRGIAIRTSQLNVQIPNIPLIPALQVGGGWWEVLSFLIGFANSIASVVNVIVSVLNIVLNILTFLIFMIIEGVNSLRSIFINA